MQHSNSNDREHLWRIKACPKGGVGFQNVGNGRMMNIQPQDSYNGGRIGSWNGVDPCYPDQNFRIISYHYRANGGSFRIYSTRAKRYLDAPWEGKRIIDGIKGNAVLHLWKASRWGRKNRIFTIDFVSGSFNAPPPLVR